MSDIVERLRAMEDALDRDAADEIERLRRAIGSESHEIEQRIAALFPDEFPKYPDDWEAGDDRCAGDHTSVTLVMKLCDEVERLRKIVDAAIQWRRYAAPEPIPAVMPAAMSYTTTYRLQQLIDEEVARG